MVFILSILTSFLVNIEGGTLSSDCVLTISSEQSQSLSYPGSFVMNGDKFRFVMMGYEAVYDGSTLYFYSDDTQELTLSNPTKDELQQLNPLLFAKALMTASRVEEKKANDGKHIITLYPDNLAAGITKLVLTLEKDGKKPVSVEVKEVNQTSRLVFLHPTLTSDTTPNTSFVLDKPSAFLNDLR